MSTYRTAKIMKTVHALLYVSTDDGAREAPNKTQTLCNNSEAKADSANSWVNSGCEVKVSKSVYLQSRKSVGFAFAFI